MLKESTRIWRDLGERLEIAENLSRFAGALALDGRAETAARLLSASDALYEELGATAPSYIVKRNETALTAIHEQVGKDAFAEAWEQGKALTVDQAVALALGSPD